MLESNDIVNAACDPPMETDDPEVFAGLCLRVVLVLVLLASGRDR